MSFLPIIGYPQSPFEKFNYRICKSAVGYIYELFLTNSIESSAIELGMRPDKYKISYLEKEVNSLLDKIEDLSFTGARQFKEGYYESIRDALEKNKTIFFSHSPIDELVHNYLRSLNWDLKFSNQDLKEAESLEDPSEFEHYLVNGTDLLQRHSAIEEMAYMLFCCERLFDLKLEWKRLQEVEQPREYTDDLIKRLVVELSNKIKLATNPGDAERLYKYFQQADLSTSSESISIGCTNQDLWYILHKFSSINKKFKIAKIAQSGFLKSSSGTQLRRTNLDRAKTFDPQHKALIDKIFSEN